jgi:hypothetical protein
MRRERNGFATLLPLSQKDALLMGWRLLASMQYLKE